MVLYNMGCFLALWSLFNIIIDFSVVETGSSANGSRVKVMVITGKDINMGTKRQIINNLF